MLVNEEVVSQHAEETAFLWALRRRAVGEPHYSLEDLAALDERVDAHLDGLRVAGEVGWRFCHANLANHGPGEVFALAVLAFGAGDRDRMLEALQIGCSSPATLPGLVSALGWLDYATVSRWIGMLLDARTPAHRSVGIAACAVHCKDPGPALALAVDDPDAALRARALRTVGEVKRHDLLNRLRHHVRDEDEACRFWAAWSLALNGQQEGVALLTEWFLRDDAFAQCALQVALRALPLADSREWISSLTRTLARTRFAVTGAGVVGDPASVPWLIRRMESPELARLAGEAFTMITGVDLAYHDLDRDAPLAADEDEEMSIDKVLALDDESNLRWPAPNLVAQWWDKNHDAFAPGTRYLAGKPITSEAMVEVLVKGKQRQRAAAALELAVLDPDRVLFEVRARGPLQQEQLATCIS